MAKAYVFTNGKAVKSLQISSMFILFPRLSSSFKLTSEALGGGTLKPRRGAAWALGSLEGHSRSPAPSDVTHQVGRLSRHHFQGQLGAGWKEPDASERGLPWEKESKAVQDTSSWGESQCQRRDRWADTLQKIHGSCQRAVALLSPQVKILNTVPTPTPSVIHPVSSLPSPGPHRNQPQEAELDGKQAWLRDSVQISSLKIDLLNGGHQFSDLLI